MLTPASRRLVASLLVVVATLLGAPLSWAYTPPPMNGHVTDPGGKLSAAERDALARKLSAYRSCSTHEVVIFVADSLENESIEDVAYATFNAWQLGRAGRDNGVLLLVAPSARKVRFEVGKGLDGALPDLRANDILREHVSPHLQHGEVFLALDEGTTEVGRVLGGCPIAAATVPRVGPPAASLPPGFLPSTERAPSRPTAQKPASANPALLTALMALGIGALLAAAALGRRAPPSVAVFIGFWGVCAFGMASLFASNGPGIDLDAVTGWFALAAVLLVLVNIISWGMRRHEGRRGAGEWVVPEGSGNSSSITSAPSAANPWPSPTSPTSSTSSSSDGDYRGGGGSSGGAGSSDSY